MAEQPAVPDVVRALMALVALVGGLAMIHVLKDNYEPVQGALTAGLVTAMLEAAPFVLVGWTIAAGVFEAFRSIRSGKQEASTEA